MASAYKWRITNNKYAYITGGGRSGNEPFIAVNNMYNNQVVDESAISRKANTLSEAAYKGNYSDMVGLISSDPDGKNLELLNYSYYYNMDNNTNCSTLKYGEQGVGIADITQTKENGVNTIKFLLTNGESYEITINDGQDGERGVAGPRGLRGAVGASGTDGTTSEIDESEVRRIVNNMNITEATKEAVLYDINPTLNSLTNDVQTIYYKTNSAIGSFDTIKTNAQEAKLTANSAFRNSETALQTASEATDTANAIFEIVTSNTERIETLEEEVASLETSVDELSMNVATVRTQYQNVLTLVNSINQNQINMSGFSEDVNERFSACHERLSKLESTSIDLSFSVSSITETVGILSNIIKNDVSGLDYVVNTFVPEASEQFRTIDETIGNIYDDIRYVSKSAVTMNVVETMINTKLGAGLNNFETELEGLRQGVRENAAHIYDVSARTFSYLDPNVDILLRYLPSVLDAISALTSSTESNRRDIDILLGRLSGGTDDNPDDGEGGGGEIVPDTPDSGTPGGDSSYEPDDILIIY